MSAFAYCLDCHELATGVLDTSKGFLLHAASNHDRCKVQPFGDVAALPAPIRNGIARLGAGLPMSDTTITLFRLGLDLHDYPTGAQEAECPPAQSSAPAAASTSPTSPAPVPPSAAYTRSLPASPPISVIAASDEQMTLFEAVS